MKDTYADPDNWAVVQLMKISDRSWLITAVGVNRKYRGQGHASALMKKVIEDADREGVALLLSIQPDPDGLTTEELSDWYGRLGFAPHREDPNARCRFPVKEAAQ